MEIIARRICSFATSGLKLICTSQKDSHLEVDKHTGRVFESQCADEIQNIQLDKGKGPVFKQRFASSVANNRTGRFAAHSSLETSPADLHITSSQTSLSKSGWRMQRGFFWLSGSGDISAFMTSL